MLADRPRAAARSLLVATVGMALAYGALAFVASPVLAVAVIFVAGLFEAAYHPTAFRAARRPHPARGAGPTPMA